MYYNTTIYSYSNIVIRMIMEENERRLRGYSILAKGDKPVALNEETFLVPSQSSQSKTIKYRVSKINGWTCECKDFKYRNKICKHIYAIQFWLKLRDGIDSNELMQIENSKETDGGKCEFCKSSNIVMNGSRKTKTGIRQRFLCKDCKKRFVIEPIKHLKVNSKMAILTMDLFYKGLSLRDIADTIYQFYGIKIHHETIRRWITRFTQIMNEYTKKLKPKVSDAWHIDEQMISVKGKHTWSWNVLDEETRFLITNNITKKRDVNDARKIMRKAKESTETKPEFIITDGLNSYTKAFKREFPAWWTNDRKTVHIRLKNLETHPNNNLIERYHSTFRDFDKVRRGFKSDKTAQTVSDGFTTYYNFIKKHKGLNGLTPSQKADLDLQLERNRWLSLLKKSLGNQ